MGNGRKVVCVLCQRSEETKITGPLSTKDSVTAHQNCLLYSSGICCQSSPQFDDLFGFSVEDVKEEVKRGNRLYCNECKQKGATAGCGNKRCKKSYHYPCAVQQGAVNDEDDVAGTYELYCNKHSKQREGTINSPASSTREPETNNTPNEAPSSKVVCLTCQNKEENISLDSLNTGIMLYCEKHKPSRRWDRLNSGDAVAGPSSGNSDSNSSNSWKGLSSKRRFTSNGKQEGTPSKLKSSHWQKRINDGSSNSDDADIALFAPLESDLEESVTSNPGHQTVPEFVRNDAESPTAAISGNHLVGPSRSGDKEEDEILSDTESESLLLPVMVCIESENSQATGASLEQYPGTYNDSIHCPDLHTARPSSPQRGSTDPPPCPGYSKPLGNTSSPPRTNLAVSPAPPENGHVPPSSSRSSSTSSTLLPCSSPPLSISHPPVPEPSLDAANFWKGCNEAGCTQDIFTDFIAEMSNISNRIKSDRASQEDYNLALRVMEASGKLAELVAKQQEELKKRQTELERAAAAIKRVMSSLRK